MQYLFDAWDLITSKINKSYHVLIMFDFDGTLTPIIDSLDLVKLNDGMRDSLRALSLLNNFTVAIVSGRAMKDLLNKAAIPEIIYAGNHGFEIGGPAFNFVHPKAKEIIPILRIISKNLKKALSKIQLVVVEDKGITLTVHYRLADHNQLEHIKRVVYDTVAMVDPIRKVRITSGKKSLEIRPAVHWDKGKAVKFIIKHYSKKSNIDGLLPIYLGDDLTDEDAFKVVEDYGGIAVYVGGKNSTSVASFYLRSVGEVEDYVKKLPLLHCEETKLE